MIKRTLCHAFAVHLLLAHMAPAVAADAPERNLPQPIAQALAMHRVPATGLSIYVHPIGAQDPVLAVAPDEPRNPASTIKLLTTLAALEVLGPAYRWRTEAYALGRVRNGRLAGDLYLKGYGDPFLVMEHFWKFMREIKAQGLTSVAGDLMLDQSHFALEDTDPAAFDGAPTRAYNALPRALMVNFQAVHLRLTPAAGGVRISADPPLPIVNRMTLVRTPCHGGAHGWHMRVDRRGDRSRLIFGGRYAQSCGEYEFFRVLLAPAAHIHAMFRALWSELGGRLDGGVREGVVPADAQLVHTAYSPPLADIVRSINKYSNNLMTRQLLLTLGAEWAGAPGTTSKGIAAVQEWLRVNDLKFPELVLDNGSGLSRDERISARHLGELLLKAYAGPYMPEFMSALPVSAVDGTLQQRYAGDLAGRLHLKTGSLDGVRAIAGYVLDRAGRRVVVVCLHNHPAADTAGGAAVQQALLEWVYDRP